MLVKYKNQLEKLELERQQLMKIDKNSKTFAKKLKKYLKIKIQIKSNTWCMDNELERSKMLKLIWEEIENLI